MPISRKGVGEDCAAMRALNSRVWLRPFPEEEKEKGPLMWCTEPGPVWMLTASNQAERTRITFNAQTT